MFYTPWQLLVELQVRRAAELRSWSFSSRTVAATGSVYVVFRRRQDKYSERVLVRFSSHYGSPEHHSSMWVLYRWRDSLHQVLRAFREDRFPYGYLRRPSQQVPAAVGRSVPQVCPDHRGCGMIGDPAAAWTPDGRHLENRPPTQPRGVLFKPGGRCEPRAVFDGIQ